MGKTTRSFAAWIACLAMLLASFAPMLAHAWTARQSSSALQMEICSVVGSAHAKALEAGDTSQSSESAPTSHLEHCPFCLGHIVPAVLPPVSGLVLPVPDIAHGFPSLYYQAPRRLFIWSSALSRAPPAVV